MKILTRFLIIFFSIVLFLLTSTKVNAQKYTELNDIGCDAANGEVLIDSKVCCPSVQKVCETQLTTLQTVDPTISKTNCSSSLKLNGAYVGTTPGSTLTGYCKYIKDNNDLLKNNGKDASFNTITCPPNTCEQYIANLGGNDDEINCYKPAEYLDPGYIANNDGGKGTPREPRGDLSHIYQCCADAQGNPIFEVKPRNSTGNKCKVKYDPTNTKINATVQAKLKSFYSGSSFQLQVKSAEDICRQDSKVYGDPAKEKNTYDYCCECFNPKGKVCQTVTPVDNPLAYDSQNIWTGIGCISTSNDGLAKSAMRIFIGIFAVVMLIRVIQAGYLYQFGDPEKIKESKEILISVLLSVFIGSMGLVILEFIGVGVLGLGDLLGSLPKVIP